jgi:predicted nucleic acid-binding Zn finger protein
MRSDRYQEFRVGDHVRVRTPQKHHTRLDFTGQLVRILHVSAGVRFWVATGSGEHYCVSDTFCTRLIE